MPCMSSFWISQPDDNLPQLKKTFNSCQGCLDKPDFHSFPQGNPDTFVTSKSISGIVVLLTFSLAGLLSLRDSESLAEGAGQFAEICTTARIVQLHEVSPELRNFKYYHHAIPSTIRKGIFRIEHPCMLGSVMDATCREINLIITQTTEQKGEPGPAHL